ACVVLALLALALIAPIAFPVDPNEITGTVLQPPSLEHVLGTDDLGRDVLTGLIYGIQVSLTVGVLAAFGATLIGGLVGAVAGFYGGLLDLFVMRISEIFQVVPSFILAAVIAALSGPGLWQIIAVIAFLSWPQTARVMRGEVIRVKHLDFVDAVRCLGIDEGTILLKEIIPNAIAPMLAVGTLIVGSAILLEASLSFLGLSSPDIVSWGRMLNTGQRYLFIAWWLSLFPGLCIVVTVLAFNLLGDAIGAALNPRGSD
ncbi:MAG: ABC transporter permease, partial [Alphaproteobacteria bacterium]|nr:ABC transporter permease [Alphaproteobacteria bacterium]